MSELTEWSGSFDFNADFNDAGLEKLWHKFGPGDSDIALRFRRPWKERLFSRPWRPWFNAQEYSGRCIVTAIESVPLPDGEVGATATLKALDKFETRLYRL